MAITADFHNHTSFSSDCKIPMEEMIQKGISLGMTHLCFTEHMDPDYPVSGDGLTFLLDTDAYRSRFLELKEKYSSNIELLWGVELGIQPHLYEQLHTYASSYPFDFIIASSHVLYGEDPYYPSFFEQRKEATVYADYFKDILTNIKHFSDFDVYGHLDYIVRYGPNKDARYSYEAYRDIFDEILKTLVQTGKGLEVNTGGLKYGLLDLHPLREVLKRYRELGGEIITVGSDAHSPDYLQHQFSFVREVLTSLGYRYYSVFKNRTCSFLPL